MVDGAGFECCACNEEEQIVLVLEGWGYGRMGGGIVGVMGRVNVRRMNGVVKPHAIPTSRKPASQRQTLACSGDGGDVVSGVMVSILLFV